jgi:hypothetical protein
MPMVVRRSGSRRWAGAALVLTCGAVGALGGWMVVNALVPPPSSPYSDWIVFFALLAALVAGPIVGVFAGLLLLRGLRHEVACPRCGTANPKQADACSACDLAFMSLEGSRMG